MTERIDCVAFSSKVSDFAANVYIEVRNKYCIGVDVEEQPPVVKFLFATSVTVICESIGPLIVKMSDRAIEVSSYCAGM